MTADEQAVAAAVRDERAQMGRRFLLPKSFTGGLAVYAVDMVIERRQLPEGFLTEKWIVCEAIPGEQGPVYMKRFN